MSKHGWCRWALLSLLVVLGATFAAFISWRLSAQDKDGNEELQAQCRRNLTILSLELKFYLIDQGDRGRNFIAAVAKGEDPLIWIAQDHKLEPAMLVCPQDEKREAQAWLKGESVPKDLKSPQISYETWPWRAGLEEALPILSPMVWDKQGFHEGKRMVVTFHGSLVLMLEADFQKSMKEARTQLDLPEDTPPKE
jgi:hypothetical protein